MAAGGRKGTHYPPPAAGARRNSAEFARLIRYRSVYKRKEATAYGRRPGSAGGAIYSSSVNEPSLAILSGASR